MLENDKNDPRAPLFFLSYAHAAELRSQGGRERNRLVIKFFRDLSENVGYLVSRPAGADPAIAGGAHWTAELLEAIGTSQVFVALLSAQYFTSEWCSKEWHAFSQRDVISFAGGRPDHQTAIIPVVWAPVPDDRIPPVVAQVQRFSPAALPHTNIAAQYKDHGIVGLLQMRRATAYQGVVWQLAQHIASFHYNHRVEPRTLRESDLRDIFLEHE